MTKSQARQHSKNATYYKNYAAKYEIKKARKAGDRLRRIEAAKAKRAQKNAQG